MPNYIITHGENKPLLKVWLTSLNGGVTLRAQREKDDSTKICDICSLTPDGNLMLHPYVGGELGLSLNGTSCYINSLYER